MSRKQFVDKTSQRWWNELSGKCHLMKWVSPHKKPVYEPRYLNTIAGIIFRYPLPDKMHSEQKKKKENEFHVPLLLKFTTWNWIRSHQANLKWFWTGQHGLVIGVIGSKLWRVQRARAWELRVSVGLPKPRGMASAHRQWEATNYLSDLVASLRPQPSKGSAWFVVWDNFLAAH